MPALSYGCDLQAMARAVTDKTKSLYMRTRTTQPELGNQPRADEISRFIPSSVWVVLDEAYFEYVDDSEYPQGLELQAKSQLNCYSYFL